MAKKIILTYEINIGDEDYENWDWFSLIRQTADLGLVDKATLTNAVIKTRGP